MDMVVEGGHRWVRVIGDCELAGLPERNGPVTVSRPAERTNSDRHRVQVSLVPMSHAKEISKRHINAGRLFPVVINPQPDQAGPGVLLVGHGNPDVIHDARPTKIPHDPSLAPQGAPSLSLSAHPAH